MPRTTVAETFDQHYRKEANGCWTWLRALHGPVSERNNYGHLKVRGKNMKAHRFSYERKYGEGSAEGMQVLHSCNNPQCVNPLHLGLGTMLQNQAQKAKELRAGKKLTPAKVRAIRTELAKNRPQHAIAKEFGVCQMNISYISRNLIWQHA